MVSIKQIIDFFFFPFQVIIWIIKIIINYITQEKLIKFQKEEGEKNRRHELEKQKNELDYKRYEQEQKTKRLNMTLKNKKELAEINYRNNNPNAVSTLILLRKNKKGRKTK